MHYKLLIADIDGTVVDHNSTGSEIHGEHPSKQAVAEAESAGKLVSFATGRNYPKAKSVVQAFGLTVPVIVNNGSQIVDPTSDEVLWERRLDSTIGGKIYDFIVENHLDYDS